MCAGSRLLPAAPAIIAGAMGNTLALIKAVVCSQYWYGGMQAKETIR